MRRIWFVVALSVVVIAAAGLGAMILFARPAPNHPFFASERPRVDVIAHRGGAGLRPENTVAAFSHAVEIGADVLEMDVRRTADGAIVVLHDATVDRTSNGSGRVDTFTLSELQKLDAGYRWSVDGGRTFPFRGAGVRVPALQEVLVLFPAVRMNVEIKNPPGTELARPLCGLIRRHETSERVLVASMSEEAIAEFRRVCPEVASSLTASEARTFVYASIAWLAAAYSPPATALQIPDRISDQVVATPDLIATAHRRNLKVHVWTINDEQRMRELVGAGVDGIITDRPDLLKGVLARARR